MQWKSPISVRLNRKSHLILLLFKEGRERRKREISRKGEIDFFFLCFMKTDIIWWHRIYETIFLLPFKPLSGVRMTTKTKASLLKWRKRLMRGNVFSCCWCFVIVQHNLWFIEGSMWKFTYNLLKIVSTQRGWRKKIRQNKSLIIHIAFSIYHRKKSFWFAFFSIKKFKRRHKSREKFIKFIHRYPSFELNENHSEKFLLSFSEKKKFRVQKQVARWKFIDFSRSES